MSVPILLFSVLIAGQDRGVAATTAPPLPASAASTRAPELLPPEWLGLWTGPAVVEGGSLPRRFTMELRVAAGADPATLSWTIVYGEGEAKQERPYTLVAVDAAKGELAIDEGNGIVLPTRRLGDSLWSAFAVEQTMLVASYRLERHDQRTPEDDTITVEIATMPTEPSGTTGNTPAAGGGVPRVDTFQIRSLQRAVLRRTPTPGTATP